MAASVRRRSRWSVGALLLAAACSSESDEPDPAQVRADAIGELQTALIERSDGSLDETMAACVATGLVDAYGPEEVEQTLLEAEPEGDVRSTVVDIFAACDALDAVLDVTGS